MKITKTMQKLLDRKMSGTELQVHGMRECKAAQALVNAGLAKRYESLSYLSSGQSYYNHFRRCWATAKPCAVLSGVVYF